MPNHVTTEIRCADPRALAALLTDGGEVDFSFLVPPPANLETGDCSGKHEPGVVCWYEWNSANWGTKWNAYSSDVDTERVRFETAWSHPLPVIETLSLKFPRARLEVEYADEDLGHNLGRYAMINGKIVFDVTPAEGSDAANDFAARLKYGRSYAELRAEWDADDDALIIEV